MKEIYIWHHLGLGDHILCNALVRNIAKQYDKVFLFVKTKNLNNVKFMYRDLPKINFIDGRGDQDEFVDFFIITHPGINLLKIGFNYLNTSSLNFDEAFYEQVGLPFSKKFDDFYIERDLKEENRIYQEVNPNEEPYIFIHQDINRGFRIDLSQIKRKDLKIIEAEIKYPIFLLGKVIECAEEVHVMESSIKCFIDCLITHKENMYFHQHPKKFYMAKGRNYWKIINKNIYL
jgi:hypothetical protein